MIFVLGGLWLHPVSFFVVGAVMLAGTQNEYYKMVRSTGIRPQLVTGIITGFLVYFTSTLVAMGWLPRAGFMALIPVISIIMVIELFRKAERPFDSLAHTFFSIIYTAFEPKKQGKKIFSSKTVDGGRRRQGRGEHLS